MITEPAPYYSALTTTDYTVLGIVWRDGPCTTYTVMRELASSASTFYRNRAATTYRVAQRLVDQGLLEPVSEEVGSRRERLLRATAAGTAELRRWLRPPIPRVEVAHTIDLVRLRTFFLAALNRSERVSFVRDAIAAAKARMLEAETLESNARDPFDALGARGVVFETKARIEWLEEVRATLPSLP